MVTRENQRIDPAANGAVLAEAEYSPVRDSPVAVKPIFLQKQSRKNRRLTGVKDGARKSLAEGDKYRKKSKSARLKGRRQADFSFLEENRRI